MYRQRFIAASFAAFAAVVSFDARESMAQAAEGSAGPEATGPAEGTVSLAEVAPELYFQLRRYPKFYGDPNTTEGGIIERSQLLGSVGGLRDSLADSGFYVDVSVTQFLQGNLSGGVKDDEARYNGSADYWVTFDSGKAGLWPGGAIFLHAESSWQADKSINVDTGSLVPPNYDATMPTPGESEELALPELYLVQALPDNWLLIAGKVDWAGLGDTNVLANNEHTQFSYTGLVNNPILGAFIPYTSLGLGTVWAPSKAHQVAVIGIQAKGKATSSGFDNFDGDYTFGVQYTYSMDLGDDRPGNYRVLAGYDTRDVTDFAIDPRHLLGEILGLIPTAEKSSNRAVVLSIDQFIWTRGGGSVTGRAGQPPVGIGIFARAGWTPEDRNVIDQFYSLGIGGFGMLIPGRDYDQWGIGWAGTHISDDLRDDAAFLTVDLHSFEHAVEAYYSFQLTPAVALTFNAQVIDSTVDSVDTAYTLGTRLQIDF
jgi:porin